MRGSGLVRRASLGRELGAARVHGALSLQLCAGMRGSGLVRRSCSALQLCARRERRCQARGDRGGRRRHVRAVVHRGRGYVVDPRRHVGLEHAGRWADGRDWRCRSQRSGGDGGPQELGLVLEVVGRRGGLGARARASGRLGLGCGSICLVLADVTDEEKEACADQSEPADHTDHCASDEGRGRTTASSRAAAVRALASLSATRRGFRNAAAPAGTSTGPTAAADSSASGPIRSRCALGNGLGNTSNRDRTECGATVRCKNLGAKSEGASILVSPGSGIAYVESHRDLLCGSRLAVVFDIARDGVLDEGCHG